MLLTEHGKHIGELKMLLMLGKNDVCVLSNFKNQVKTKVKMPKVTDVQVGVGRSR